MNGPVSLQSARIPRTIPDPVQTRFRVSLELYLVLSSTIASKRRTVYVTYL